LNPALCAWQICVTTSCVDCSALLLGRPKFPSMPYWHFDMKFTQGHTRAHLLSNGRCTTKLYTVVFNSFHSGSAWLLRAPAPLCQSYIRPKGKTLGDLGLRDCSTNLGRQRLGRGGYQALSHAFVLPTFSYLTAEVWVSNASASWADGRSGLELSGCLGLAIRPSPVLPLVAV